jgi:hypothetical protein
MSKVIGVVGGVVGGWGLAAMSGAEGMVAVAIGAWVGSILLNEIYGLATGGLKR